MAKNNNLSELLSLDEVATALKVHKETLRRWDISGKLKAVRIGNRGDRRYRKVDIENFISNKNK
jgi:excisionase family DNA binding protein